MQETKKLLFAKWRCFVDAYYFGCHSGKFSAAAIMCNTVNFNTGTRWQATSDLTVTLMGEPKRKRGRPRKKDVPMVQPPQAVPHSSATVTIIEEYIPTSLTSQQASILSAASGNLDHPQTSTPYSMMAAPPLDLFGACPNVRVKRRFITPEQKQRQLELARARKKRFRERLKEKAMLQQRSVEELTGRRMDPSS
jgi:hypothetical protein